MATAKDGQVNKLMKVNMSLEREVERLAMLSVLPGIKTRFTYEAITYDTVKFIFDNYDYFIKFGNDTDFDRMAWDVQLLRLDHTDAELTKVMHQATGPTEEQIQTFKRHTT